MYSLCNTVRNRHNKELGDNAKWDETDLKLSQIIFSSVTLLSYFKRLHKQHKQMQSMWSKLNFQQTSTNNL